MPDFRRSEEENGFMRHAGRAVIPLFTPLDHSPFDFVCLYFFQQCRVLIVYCELQGGLRTAIKYQGSFFFKLTSGLGLTNYVSGRLSIYGNSISNFQ